MKYFSLKRYFSMSMGYLAGFTFILASVIICSIADVESVKLASAIVIPICAFALLLPGAYYLYRFFSCKKKAEGLPRLRGAVCNWELGAFTRYYAAVSVISEGQEYSTSHYISYEYARELVGREIEYCIIDDILFIFSVRD